MEPNLSQITLSQAIQDFSEAKRAQRLSPHTLADYGITHEKLKAFLSSDPPLVTITVHQLRCFLNSLDQLSKKTLFNVHVALSSLWTWAINEGLCQENPMRRIPRAKPEKRRVQPFTQSEVKAMLRALKRSVPYTHPGKRACSNRLKNTLRDHALILCLLDTGIRASEVAGIKIEDIGCEGILVFGKGSKERTVPISEETRQVIEEYLTQRGTVSRVEPLFASRHGGALDRHSIRLVIYRIANRAKVFKAHPHRFRHTFAINFLRNGGDPYSLQEILGHSSLDTVRIYLQIANTDLLAAHQRASPVKRWGLGKLSDD